MRTSNLLLVCVAAALPLGAVTAYSPDWHGVQARFESKLEPPPAGTTDPGILGELRRYVSGGVIVNDGVHRVWRDEERKVYVGYDLSVSPEGGAQTFRLSILPLSLAPRQIGTRETWTQVPLPRALVMKVRIGDTVAIDVVVNPATGQKLVDYLTLERVQPVPAAAPHDFTLADADLSIEDPHLSVDGTPVDLSAVCPCGISGNEVWFYLRGRGRFKLSLIPKPELGFRKAGQVSFRVLTLRADGVEYRVESRTRIAPGEGTYNIYVLHEPAWRPADFPDPFILASGPLEYSHPK